MHKPPGLNYTKATNTSRELSDKSYTFNHAMGFWGFGVVGRSDERC